MTPVEKARELWWKYYSRIEHKLSEEYSLHDSQVAKELALIAVDEMIGNAGFIWGGRDTETGKSARDSYRDYWLSVKHEIEKL
jgi:hypothetical protein